MATADNDAARLEEQRRRIRQRHLDMQQQKQQEQEQEQEPPKPPLIVVSVLPGKLEAEIELQRVAEHTADPPAEDMLAALKSQGVVFGINEAIINQLARQPVYGRRIPVANGKKPLAGKDGFVRYLVRTERELKPREREDGTVDYRDLGFIDNVSQGQVLADVVPPEKGVDGRDVYGEIIESPVGREAPAPVGRNTVYDAERHAVIAEVDGSVEVVRGSINVQDVLRIRGDVDISTGNITFPGDIHISGNVAPSLSVVSQQGNIVIMGRIENATVQAVGNITVNGMDHATVTAGGSIRCKFIQYCTLKTGDSVYADSIMHCNIAARGNVELAGKRAVLMGGVTAVSGVLRAKAIGGESNTPTHIEMAADLEERDYSLQDIQDILERITGEQQALLRSATKLAELSKRGAELTQQQQDMLRKAKARLGELATERKTMEDEAARIEKENEERLNGLSYIVCSDCIHIGAKIMFGSAMLRVKEPIINSRVMMIDGEVKALMH